MNQKREKKMLQIVTNYSTITMRLRDTAIRDSQCTHIYKILYFKNIFLL